MATCYSMIHEGKELKTLPDLESWYTKKIAEFKKADIAFNELPFVELELKQVRKLLKDNVPIDNESEIFKNVLWRYLSDFLNKRLLIARTNHGPLPDYYQKHIDDFNKKMSLLKDVELQKGQIEKLIDKIKEAIHNYIDKGDLKDRHNKAMIDALQKYLAFLKEKQAEFADNNIGKNSWKIGFEVIPFESFDKLKAFRLKQFEKRKRQFIESRIDLNLTASENEIQQCYLLFLQDELKLIDQWLSDFEPDGKKKRLKIIDAKKVEIAKYQSYVQHEIKNIISPTDDSEVSSVNNFFDKIKEGSLYQVEIYNTVEKLTDKFDLTKLEILFQDFELYLMVEKDERQGAFTKKDISKAIDAWEKKNKEIPFLKFADTIETIIGKKNVKIDKVLDLEKLLYPHDFFSCYQFRNFLKAEIKNRRDTLPPENNKSNTIKSFDDLPEVKSVYILKLLAFLGITKNDTYHLSQKRKSSVRGVVEASIANNILPPIGIHFLNDMVATKIKLTLQSKLNDNTTCQDFKRQATAYIKANPLQ